MGEYPAPCNNKFEFKIIPGVQKVSLSLYSAVSVSKIKNFLIFFKKFKFKINKSQKIKQKNKIQKKKKNTLLLEVLSFSFNHLSTLFKNSLQHFSTVTISNFFHSRLKEAFKDLMLL